MPTAAELPHYIYQDYANWKGAWELIEGIPYSMTPSPTLKHQQISQKIAYQLEKQLTECPQCQALLALDWVISDETVVQPDNLVICHQEQGSFLTQAPALIFEILSPSTAQKDQVIKFRLYEEEAVLWYCLVDPVHNVAKTYHLEQGKFIKLRDISNESHQFDLIKCSIDFDFSKIWPQEPK